MIGTTTTAAQVTTTATTLGVGAFFAWFGVGEESFYIFLGFMLLDLILGITDAYLRDPKSISSCKMKRGTIKKIITLAIPLMLGAGLKAVHLVEDIPTYINRIMGILIMSELYSCIGHIFSIKTGEKLPEIDGFKMLIKSITEVISKGIKKE